MDLDGCLDPSGDIAPWASAVVDRFDSYAERSPSGTGLHVLFLARESDFAALRKPGAVTPKGGKEFSFGDHREIALYLGGRYFTVTDGAFAPSDMPGAAPVPIGKAVAVVPSGAAAARLRLLGHLSGRGCLPRP